MIYKTSAPTERSTTIYQISPEVVVDVVDVVLVEVSDREDDWLLLRV